MVQMKIITKYGKKSLFLNMGHMEKKTTIPITLENRCNKFTDPMLFVIFWSALVQTTSEVFRDKTGSWFNCLQILRNGNINDVYTVVRVILLLEYSETIAEPLHKPNGNWVGKIGLQLQPAPNQSFKFTKKCYASPDSYKVNQWYIYKFSVGPASGNAHNCLRIW